MASWLQCHLTNLSPPETDVCYKGQPAVGSRSCFKDSSPETPSCKAPGRWSAAWIWPHIRGSGSERAQAGASLILNLKSLPLRLHTPGVCLLLAVVTEGGLSCWGGGCGQPWSAERSHLPPTGQRPEPLHLPHCPCPSGSQSTSLSWIHQRQGELRMPEGATQPPTAKQK